MVCIRSSLHQPVLLRPRVPVLLRPRGPMDPNDIARSIRRRAQEVRKRGKEIGFWEWCVWGALMNVTVHMLFGSQVINVTRVFGPPTRPEPHRETHRVAAVRATSGKGYRSAVAPGSSGHVLVINHFVVGVASKSVVDVESSAGAAADPSSCAVRAAMRAGWVLRSTTLIGDCGIDVMAFHSRQVRIPPTWDKIRGQISDFMLAVQNKPEWQDSFIACQDVAVARNDLGLIFCMVAHRISPWPEGPRMARARGRVYVQSKQHLDCLSRRYASVSGLHVFIRFGCSCSGTVVIRAWSSIQDFVF